MGENVTLGTAGGNVDWFSHQEEGGMEIPQKTKNRILTDSLISFPGVNPEELKSGSKRFALSCSLQPMTEE